jgi:pimeloyl-ACP methyl ester carboxylesterase
MKALKTVLKSFAAILLGVLLIFATLVFLPERETVPRLRPRADTKYWQMKSGFMIAYTHHNSEAGRSKTPIVFLHGGPGAYVHSSSIQVLKRLTASGHDVYLYDQAGSGLSDRRPRFSDISFRTHIRDLHEVITVHIQAKRVILIGHSFGGLLAAHFSAEHPALVEKIVFSSPAVMQPLLTDPSGPVDLSKEYPTPDSLEYRKPYDFGGDVDRAVLQPKAIVATTGALLFDLKLVPDEQMDRLLNTLMARASQGAVCDAANPFPQEGGMGLYAFVATNNYSTMKDVRDTLRHLEIPVLVLHGQCDFIPYAAAYEYVDLYRNGRFVFIENAGHVIWWEQPEKYMEAIEGFVREEPQ